jgi:hypothetical protein
MTRKFVGVCSLVILLAVAMLSDVAGAWSASSYWRSFQDGNYYGVTDGDTYLRLNLSSSNKATKLAHKLNRALSKDTGLYDPGSGPCHDPKPGTQC